MLLGAWPLLSRHGYVDRGVVGVAHGGLPEPQLGVQLVDGVRHLQIPRVLGRFPKLRLGALQAGQSWRSPPACRLFFFQPGPRYR